MNFKTEELIIKDDIGSSCLPVYDLDHGNTAITWGGGFNFNKVKQLNKVEVPLFHRPGDKTLRSVINTAIITMATAIKMSDHEFTNDKLTSIADITTKMDSHDLALSSLLVNQNTLDLIELSAGKFSHTRKIRVYCGSEIPEGLVIGLSEPEFLGVMVVKDNEVGVLIYNQNAVVAGYIL